MLDPSKIPIRATTQEHLDVEDIRDDIVILRDGGCCLILQVSALNFGLLSEQEQDATILAYAGLLNSLTFPIQILIRSKKSDISDYLASLKKEEENQNNLALRSQIEKYRRFIEATIRQNKVLEKKFYIIIPFSALELGIKPTAGTFSKRKALPFQKEYIVQKAKNSLFPKRDHLLRLFNRLGLKVEQLNTQRLIELFYSIYNPESSGTQKPSAGTQYTNPLVEAAIEQPAARPPQPAIKPNIPPPPIPTALKA